MAVDGNRTGSRERLGVMKLAQLTVCLEAWPLRSYSPANH